MKNADPQLKTLVATACVTPEVRPGMATGKLCGLFIKPYPVDVFLGKIAELIRSRRTARPL
jgi:hypothetical protein